MRATVSEKGQITIPKRLRDELAIAPGQAVEVERDGKRLVISKVVARDPLEEVTGIIDLGMSVDEFMRLVRDRPDDL
jgi:AbrB family looped-hinge helix DNA binding protein